MRLPGQELSRSDYMNSLNLGESLIVDEPAEDMVVDEPVAEEDIVDIQMDELPTPLPLNLRKAPTSNPEPPPFTDKVSYKIIEGDFWLAWYMDFTLIVNKKSGYINATRLCIDNNKNFGIWLRTKNAQNILHQFIKLEHERLTASNNTALTTPLRYLDMAVSPLSDSDDSSDSDLQKLDDEGEFRAHNSHNVEYESTHTTTTFSTKKPTLLPTEHHSTGQNMWT